MVTDVIYNPLKDTEGFVGYLPSNESIYVVFRGSSSIQNWITNLNFDKDNYKIWPECNCQVHDGFQSDFLSVANTVATAVNRLAWKYPHYAIKTTGHSLGAALAHHAGMYLLKNGYTGVTMINFGQPRLGDDTYSTFAINTWASKSRVTHCKDTVPHVPLEDQGFKHTDTEQFQSCGDDWTITQCDGSGEDPHCCDKFLAFQWSVDDHLMYMGECIGSDCGQCGNAMIQ